jgi:hypothetical protein
MMMAMPTVARVMATAMRVLGKQQQGQWWRPRLWQATMRGIAMAMRVASNKEGEGSKAIEMVLRVVGKQQRWQRGWRARMRAMARAARAARAMAMAQRGQLQGRGQWLDQFTNKTKSFVSTLEQPIAKIKLQGVGY